MTVIVLSPDQSETVAKAIGKVEVHDVQGNVLGTLTPRWTQEDLELAERRLNSNGPWRTTQEVLEHLQSLEPQQQ